MRILLAILITAGLILNSGSGFVAAAYAKASMNAMGSAHPHPMTSQQTMHSHGKQAPGCHKPSSKSPAHGCKCCDTNAKCTH